MQIDENQCSMQTNLVLSVATIVSTSDNKADNKAENKILNAILSQPEENIRRSIEINIPNGFTAANKSEILLCQCLN